VVDCAVPVDGDRDVTVGYGGVTVALHLPVDLRLHVVGSVRYVMVTVLLLLMLL